MNPEIPLKETSSWMVFLGVMPCNSFPAEQFIFLLRSMKFLAPRLSSTHPFWRIQVGTVAVVLLVRFAQPHRLYPDYWLMLTSSVFFS